MKNLILVFCVLFCLNIPVFAVDFNNKLDVFNNFYEYANGFYNFKPLDKKSYKSLTEQQKASYESICKANKLWVKGSH